MRDRIIKNKVIIRYILFTLALSPFISCTSQSSKHHSDYIIHTKHGNIEIVLYAETPLHKDNFNKLVESSFYEQLLFHRVIKDFMIQGGDPASRDAKPGQPLGSGGPSYTIPAEFNPRFIHKKGALAAARQGDQVNPRKESSGSQFYIVQGKIVSDAELDKIEEYINNSILSSLYREEYARLQQEAFQKDEPVQHDDIVETAKQSALEKFNAQGKFSYTKEQREIYKTSGGTPHLDMNYTVFGEITMGIEVIDKIANEPTDNTNRPLSDISFKIAKVK